VLEQEDHNVPLTLDQDGPEIPPPIPVFSLRGALSPLLWIPVVLSASITLFAPDNILDVWPAAQRFVDWVQGMVPFMNMRAHADSTTYPQVAWLTHSMTVVLVPTLSLVWLWQSIVNYPILLARRRGLGRLTLKQHLAILVCAPLILGGIYVLIAIPGDPSFALGFTTRSRGGLAFLSLGFQYPGTLVLGGQLISFRMFIDTYLRKDS
jgi:hypothetical protein